MRRPLKWKAGPLGKLLRLTREERTRLRIKTIRAFDMTAEEGERQRREKGNAKRRTMTRAEYEANARALRAEAAALAITPDALRKRRQRAASKAVASAV